MKWEEPTELQCAYVDGLCSQLRLPKRFLDAHCQSTRGKRYAEMNRGEVSQLIDELKEWTALPAELLRAQGQQDLF
jgi:hypothetical protein